MEFDDTDMTAEEFEGRMAAAVPADVSNLGGRLPVDWDAPPKVLTGSTAVTHSADVRLAGNETITRTLAFAGR